MSENKRILQLYTDLYAGNPWIDVTLLGTLKEVSAEHAAYRFAPSANTIWEIVNHIINWRINIIQKLQGAEITTPDNNYFEKVPDTSPEAWKHTLISLEHSQTTWIAFLENMGDDVLERSYTASAVTGYTLIHGILQHDAYHLGQIVFLAKHTGLQNK